MVPAAGRLSFPSWDPRRGGAETSQACVVTEFPFPVQLGSDAFIRLIFPSGITFFLSV